MKILHGRSDSRDSTSLHHGQWNPLYGVSAHLKPGDLIIAEAEAEITNNEASSAALCSTAIIVSSVRYGTYETSLASISDDNGGNITVEMHHYTHSKCGSYLWTGAEGNYWINFCGYWDSDLLTDGTLEASNRSYGHIGVTIIRPDAGESIGPLT